MIMYNYSKANMSLEDSYVTKNHSEEIKEQLLNYKYVVDGVGGKPLDFVCGFLSLRDQADELEDIILKIDWSVWFDIFMGEFSRRFEYAGVVCWDKIDNYYAAIFYRGNNHSVYCARKFFTRLDISIHSHTMVFNGGNCIDIDERPSVTDFNMSKGVCSIVVTKAGVIMYGRPIFMESHLNRDWKDNINIYNQHIVLRKYEWSSLRLPNAKNTRYFKFTDNRNVISKPVINDCNMIFAYEYNCNDDDVPFTLFYENFDS